MKIGLTINMAPIIQEVVLVFKLKIRENVQKISFCFHSALNNPQAYNIRRHGLFFEFSRLFGMCHFVMA